MDVRPDDHQRRDRRDRPAPPLVLGLAGPQGPEDERQREQVGPDQEMDRPDAGREHRRRPPRPAARPAVAEQPARQRAVEPGQPQRRRRDRRRPAPAVDQQRQRRRRRPTTGRPRGRRRGCRSACRRAGTSPLRRISRPSRRCQNVPGSFRNPVRPPTRTVDQDEPEDQVRDPRRRTAANIAIPASASRACRPPTQPTLRLSCQHSARPWAGGQAAVPPDGRRAVANRLPPFRRKIDRIYWVMHSPSERPSAVSAPWPTPGQRERLPSAPGSSRRAVKPPRPRVSRRDLLRLRRAAARPSRRRRAADADAARPASAARAT